MNILKSKKRRVIAGIIVILLVWFIYSKMKAPSGRPVDVQPVGVAIAKITSIPEYYPAIGTVAPYNSVLIQSRVDGFLTAVHFVEGDYVEKGELLVEIDPRPFEIQLRQAQAALARDMAILKEAKLDLVRYRRLIKEESVSLQQLQSKESLVGQYEGTVMADEATIANAKLQLTYSKVTAPISGRLGLKTVDVGDIVRSSDSNGIVRITQSDPSFVIFTIVEKRIPDLLDAMQKSKHLTSNVVATTNSTQTISAQSKTQGLVVEAWDQQNSRKLASGRLLTLDNQIDSGTGTVKAKALFDNAEGKLFPNQFVNVRLLLRSLDNSLVVPTSAVQRSNNGFFVFVITPEKKEEGEEQPKAQVDKKERTNSTTERVRPPLQYGTATIRTITTGYATDTATVITNGIEPDDIVVTDGVDQLREGSSVSYTLEEVQTK